MKKIPHIILVVLLAIGALQAQSGGFYAEPDTVPDIDLDYVPKIKAKIFAGRPGKAALYSLILPGAGQAYNKKYWQVPIVWAGIGTAGYIMLDNANSYQIYRDAYRERLIAAKEGTTPVIPDDLPDNIKIFLAGATDDQIKNQRDNWNRYRQISIFAFAAIWIANSAQAYVGAHLKDFDVSDDLSIELVPFMGGDLANTAIPVSSGIILRF